MPAQIIDGKMIAQQIKDEIKAKVSALNERGVYPALAVVIAGDDPASHVYVKNKRIACEYTGIRSSIHTLPGDAAEGDVVDLIEKLNQDPEIHGILVQSPLPGHLDEEKIQLRVSQDKDVDCFNPYNIGLVSLGKSRFKPCTPEGVVELLKRSQIQIEGKHCVVLGRSNIVGKPAAALLLAENGTMTTCHSKTKDLPGICRQADILVAAVGKPGFVTADMVKDGAVVIDVGIHRSENNKLRGDVDYDACFAKAGYITPVPGGVGPMTIAMLMMNCLRAGESA